MNQPSASDLVTFFYSEPDTPKEAFKRILDRYHLIDKADPVSGGVTLPEFEKYFLDEGYVATYNHFDIYHKGTVARLQAEVERLSSLDDENVNLFNKAEQLQAEVDRLKALNPQGLDFSIAETAKTTDELMQKLNAKKPEAMGCGNYFVDGGIYSNCGTNGSTCPDCRAKTNHPEKPDSSKNVSLPEVPNAKETNFGEWIDKAEKIMQAVKQWIEAQGEKN